MHPALKLGLLEWKAQSHRTEPTDFVSLLDFSVAVGLSIWRRF